jgi:uroporphyrinogen decarboxylase
MADMMKKERVRAALKGRPVDRVPVSLWGHDFLREWRPRDLVEATLDGYREGNWDFIKFNPRATYFAEAWGNTYEPLAQRQPRLITTRVAGPEQLAEIRPVDGRSGVFADHLYALRLLLDEVGAEVDVIHTVFSPLAVAAQLCGPSTEFTRYAAANPSGAHTAVAAIASTLTEYALTALATGASGIFFAPLTWASRDTSSEDFYREFGRPYDLQLLGAIAGAPFNILHVCRNHNMIDLLLDYPVAAFNWADQGDGNPSLGDVKARTARAVMGGIDQTRLHEMSPEEVTAQARQAVASVPSSLFLTAGCAIRPETPAATRKALAASAQS